MRDRGHEDLDGGRRDLDRGFLSRWSCSGTSAFYKEIRSFRSGPEFLGIERVGVYIDERVLSRILRNGRRFTGGPSIHNQLA